MEQQPYQDAHRELTGKEVEELKAAKAAQKNEKGRHFRFPDPCLPGRVVRGVRIERRKGKHDHHLPP
jgi:hypothetical protein